jgi:regulator of replication initiation timing
MKEIKDRLTEWADEAITLGLIAIPMTMQEARDRIAELEAEVERLKEVACEDYRGEVKLRIQENRDLRRRMNDERTAREAAQAEVERLRAEPPAPAAIVLMPYSEWHGFSLLEDAYRFNRESQVAELTRIGQWIWHPGSRPEAKDGDPS